MDRRNWLSLGQSLIEKYELCSMHPSFKSLPLQCFHVAASSNSGPIALLYDVFRTTLYTFPPGYDKSIIIFSERGEPKKLIPFNIKDRLIHFDFTIDESLLIILASGDYYLIDPHSGHIIQNNYLGYNNKQRVVGAFVKNHDVFLMRQKQLGYINGLTNNRMQILSNLKPHYQNPNFSAFIENEKVKLIFLSKEGTIQQYSISENRKKTVYESQFLSSNSSKLCSFSKDNQLLCLVFRDPFVAIYVDLSTKKEKKFQPLVSLQQEKNKKSRHNYRKICEIGWIGANAYFSDRKITIMWNMQSINMNLQSCRIVNQVDGIRIYGENQFLLRQTTQIYREIINSENIPQFQFTNPMMKKLHTFYYSYVNKEMIHITELQKIDLLEVQNCIKQITQAAIFTMNILEQVKLFKMAHFVIAYFRISYDLSNLCSELRIINNLKYENMHRSLTYAQFKYLKYEQKQTFLFILLRYNMHYMADLILTHHEAKQKIFLHWAKCKIEKQAERTAKDFIMEKYSTYSKKLKGTKVFTEMAKYCLDRNKITLANELIQFDQHYGRKIMIGLNILAIKKELSIAEKLLDYAEHSGQSFLLFRVIHQLLKNCPWLTNIYWTNNLPNRPNLQRHYIAYLKVNNEDQLLRAYYLQNKRLQQIGLWALQIDISLPQQELRSKILADYKKLLPNAAAALSKNSKKNNLDKLRQMKNNPQIDINEEYLNSFTKDLELESAAQILWEKKKQDLAIRCLRKIKSDKVYTILQRKNSFMEAVTLAYDRRDKQNLEQLLQRCPQDVEQRAQRLLAQLKGIK